MWESIQTIGGAILEPENASKEIKTQIDYIKKSIESIDLIGGVSNKKISKEVEMNAKHLGRGVAILELFNPNGSEKVSINLKSLWSSHKNAPLSTLYGFDWNPPNLDQNGDMPQLCLVLLPSGVISIQLGGDPLLEYFAGGWRYVDTYHKAMILSKLAKNFAEGLVLNDDGISLPVYRCTRLAYQLSYHNHGSTIDLIFGEPNFLPQGKLEDIISKIDIFDTTKKDWRQIYSETEDQYNYTDTEVIQEYKKIGRWVYQLCISDGITSLFIDKNSNLLLGDFGQIIRFSKDIRRTWKIFLKNILKDKSSEIDIGGARHTSAISRAYENPPYGSKGRMVFCVSQDGYIDVYMKNNWLKLR